ncbi:hypothetical protein ACF0H5_023176 [Mactra antiquata]
MAAKHKQYTFISFIESDLLFKPREGVTFKTRDEIPLLQVKYSVFVTALRKLVQDWLDGKVGIGQPSEQWEKDAIAEVNKAVNDADGFADDADDVNNVSDDLINRVYNEMVKIKVPGHLKVVTSHRKWLRLSFGFLEKIGAKVSDKMPRLIRVHDLSKYTHREVLGYAVMFGDGSVDWRKLETEAEKIEWDNTLYNHYAGNPHHPEYFYPLKDDGNRDKSVPMLKLDTTNGQDYVDESLIDMLAARGERILANDKTFNVKKWMDIPDRYMFRYAEEDKQYVIKCYDHYKELAKQFLSIESNAAEMKGFFDFIGIPDRSVVYEDYEEGK